MASLRQFNSVYLHIPTNLEGSNPQLNALHLILKIFEENTQIRKISLKDNNYNLHSSGLMDIPIV